MTEFTEENFKNDVLESSEPVLVDFWAPWCGPCKMIGPIVEALAQEYEGKGVKVGKLNIDEHGAVASQFHVMSIPTLLFFKDGEVVDQLVGVQSKDALKKKIEELKS